MSGIDKDNIKAISNDPFFPTVGFYDMTGGSIAVTDIKLRTAGDRSLTLEDLSGDPSPFSDGESGTFPLIPNNPTNLRVLVPDEARESGSNDGRSGVVDSQKAGVAFDIVVDITDGFWNLTPGASQEIRITCDDPYATITPSTLTIVSSATISVLPIRAGDLQITAETKVNPNPLWGPDLAQDNASLISVSPGDAVKLLLVMPGEDFDPGSATGKKDSPTTRKAGEDFTVKVGVVDANYNLVTGRPTDIKVSTPTDSYATVVSTVAINTLLGYTDPPISVTMRTATTHYLSALDFGGSGLIVNHSSTFTVVSDNPIGLQVLMPGEEAVPGSGDY
ncbi:MAG: hypothetical protein KAJ48_08845, partial [Elusimicrobiales bacterium]|nr:hypothetical protein [Elusimicrobiales bacterium]